MSKLFASLLSRMLSRMLFLVFSVPVWIYRLFISPFTVQSCRFLPTCSEYVLLAMNRHGVWSGGWLGLKRLSRCHPFENFPVKSLCAGHGFDPVPVEIFRAPWYAPWRVISADTLADPKND